MNVRIGVPFGGTRLTYFSTLPDFSRWSCPLVQSVLIEKSSELPSCHTGNCICMHLSIPKKIWQQLCINIGTNLPTKSVTIVNFTLNKINRSRLFQQDIRHRGNPCVFFNSALGCCHGRMCAYCCSSLLDISSDSGICGMQEVVYDVI